MQINLGLAVAGAATAISVLDEYFQELYRIEKIPRRIPLPQGVTGSLFELTFVLDLPRFEMVKPASAEPYTRLLLTGSVERRFAGDPSSPPEVIPLDIGVLLKIVALPNAEVGLSFDGLDGTPPAPLIVTDFQAFFSNPPFSAILAGIRIPSGERIIAGLYGVDPGGLLDDPVGDWLFGVTLMPGGNDTVDSFMASVAIKDTNWRPVLRQSFLPEGQEFAIAFGNTFLDEALKAGAKAQIGKTIDKAKIVALQLYMNPDSIQVDGRAVRGVTVFPDVPVSFVGPMHPYLVRGTVVMGVNNNDVVVDVGDFAEAFYTVAEWFLFVLGSALLFTGVGLWTGVGILALGAAILPVWASVMIDNAPNLTRESLAVTLAANLDALSSSLDDDTDIGQLRIDSTPDSVRVVDGALIFLAQVVVKPRTMQLVAAEYSKEFRRFVIYELEDGRRFRAQELARLIANGKVTVPGFHQVKQTYIRANPDNVAANNLLKSFKANLTSEVVVRNA
jgi:hypothetical protein